MQARFVSLRVTETWQMVQGRDANSVTPYATAPHEVDARATEPQPRELEPVAVREPSPID